MKSEKNSLCGLILSIYFVYEKSSILLPIIPNSFPLFFVKKKIKNSANFFKLVTILFWKNCDNI
jgi:hypothetical protein